MPRNPSLGWFSLTGGQADGPTCVQWTQATESSQAPPTPWRQFSRSCGGKLVLLKHCQLAAADKQAPSQSSTHSAVSGTILEHVGEMAAYHFSNISADISSLTGHFWYRVPCTRTLYQPASLLLCLGWWSMVISFFSLATVPLSFSKYVLHTRVCGTPGVRRWHFWTKFGCSSGYGPMTWAGSTTWLWPYILVLFLQLQGFGF